MSHEIYYTSAPEGIKRGTSGFCTVAASDNIPKALWDRLETLSAYRHHVGAGGQANPVSFAHWMLAIAGKTHHVLSRICDSGVDHTQRTNAFAHHLVLDAAEIAAAVGGPAWLLEQPGVMMERWNGQVGALTPSPLARGDIFSSSRVCHQWAALTGDAGWGGYLADVFAKTPNKPVCILFAPGQELLPLLGETIALLPPATRWNITFNTYFTSMPTSATCLWRCCLAGTPAAQTGLRYAANGIVLDLTDRSRLPALPAGDYVTMARTGQSTAAPRAALGAKPQQAALAELRKGPPGPKTAAPRPVYDPIGDEEEREAERQRESIFDFAAPQDEPAADAAEAGMYDLREPSAEPARPLARERQRGPAPPPRLIRRADEALEEYERDAERASGRRRRQVLLMFFGALAALGVGSALVFLLVGRGAPPPEPVSTAPGIRPRPVDSGPTVQVPDRTVQTAVVTTSGSPTSNPIAVESHPADTAPRTLASAPAYPQKVTLSAAITRPDPGTGIGDRVQSLALKAADLDPVTITALRLAFFSLQPEKSPALPNRSNTPVAYRNETLGVLTAISGSAGTKKGVSLYWKPATDPGNGTEFVFIAMDRAKPGLEFQWRAAALLRNSAVYNYIFWVLQNSSLILESGRDQPQQITMKPFTPGPLNFTDPAAELTWPADLPRDVRAIEPPAESLPSGWKADWMLEWDSSVPANARTADNGFQIISFRKPTTLAKVDAWFLLTFRPGPSGGIARVECNFAKRLQQDKEDLAKAQRDLADITKKIDDLKNDPALATFGGGIPQDMINKQNDATALCEAYKAAIAGYNELTGFDVSFDLSDKMRLATLHLQRPAQETGK